MSGNDHPALKQQRDAVLQFLAQLTTLCDHQIICINSIA
jgi:hypothetical protein